MMRAGEALGTLKKRVSKLQLLKDIKPGFFSEKVKSLNQS